MQIGPYQISGAAAAIFLAAVIGVHLGNTTVAAINPNFFHGPAVHPRDRGAALDPREIEARRLARMASAYNEYYSFDDGRAALRLACVGNCGSGMYRAPNYSAGVPYFGSREEIAAEDALTSRKIDQRYEDRLAAEAERRARFALVERYAHPNQEQAVTEAGMGGPEERIEETEELPVELEPIPEPETASLSGN